MPALQFPGVLFPNAQPNPYGILDSLSNVPSQRDLAPPQDLDLSSALMPQAPAQSPILAATQGGYAPQAPMPEAAPTPVPEKKHVGFFKRPGTAAALAALGAGLLSGDSFSHGLAKGITGYHQALQDEKDRNLPTVSPLMNGAFAMVKNHDGTYGIQKIPEVAQYQMDLESGKFDQKKQLAELQGGIRSDQRDADHKWQSGENALNRKSAADALRENIAARREQAQAMMDLRRDMFAQSQQNRQLPPRAAQQYSDHLDNIGSTTQTLAMVEPVLDTIQSGKLKIGLLDNLRNETALATGMGGDPDQVQQYAQYKQAVEYVRNNFLSLQKGVQTEGDAQRALNAIVTGRGYGPAIASNLKTFIDATKRAKARNEREAGILARTYHIEDPGDEYNPAPTSLPHGGGGGSGTRSPRSVGQAYTVGQTATNPKTGQQWKWSGHSWDPVK